MTGKQKLSLLSKSGIEDRIQPAFRSMRYDPLVWNTWLEVDELTASKMATEIPGGNINPGNFALYLLNDQLIKDGYPAGKIETPLLEDCMNEYQLFLQDNNYPIDLHQAAKMAVVLVEKRKIAENWSDVLSEISSKFRGNCIEEFVRKWETVIGIVENLIESVDELFTTFCLPDSGEFLRNLFIPAIMMLGQTDKQRLATAKKTVEEMKIQQQLGILSELNEIGEDTLARSIAEYLISKYEDVDISSSSNETYWERPFESQYSVSFNQFLALIAHIAGNEVLEERLLAKAEEILNAAHAGIEIQKTRLQKNIEIEESNINDTFSNDNDNENIQLSLLEDSGEVEASASGEEITKDAKKIANSGNEEIAFQTIMTAFNQDPEGFVKGMIEKRPKFTPGWQPSKNVRDLVEIGAYKPAELINQLLIDKNPVNYMAMQQAMKINKAAGNLEEYVNLLEGEVYCGKPGIEDFHELIACNLDLDRQKEALEVSELLQQQDGVSISDRIQYATLCGKSGKKEASRKILDKILEEDHENIDALCARGEIYADERDFENALPILTKAAELTETNPTPWIYLSNCYSDQGNPTGAIDTLKKGIIALPGRRELKTKLASVYMDQKMTADALPILQELSIENSDRQSSLMLLQALQELNHPELDDYISELYSAHPDEPEICVQYADLKLRYGGYSEAEKIVKGLQADFSKDPNWARIYAEAVAGLDPRFSKNSKQLLDDDLEEALQVINSSLTTESLQKMQNQCIKAELLLQKGFIEEAHSILQKIYENGSELSSKWFTRMQTWFAWTSAALGKVDIALSTIRDVIDSDPNLLGGQQVLAEILAFSDQSQEALEQAQLVVEMAPDLAENLLWAGEFLSNLGETDKALQVLTDGSKLVPDDIRFDLSIAQLYSLKGENEKENELIESIKGKIDQKVDSKTLTGLSKILEKTGDYEFVETILQEKYNEVPDLHNALNLAGYEYQHDQMEKALDILSTAIEKKGNSRLLGCIKADILLHLERNEEALEVLDRVQSFADEASFDLGGFIPSSWNLIQRSQDSIGDLKTRVYFEMGDIEKSSDYAANILTNDPQNSAAILYAYESTLAARNQDKLAELNDITLPERENVLFSYTFLEKIEALLFENRIDECWESYNALDDRLKSIPQVQIVEANLLFIEGNIKEAEALFLECKSKVINNLNPSFILRLIDARAMIKTAWKLRRWNEALTWVNQWAKAYPWNKDFLQLYVKILVESLEFEDSADFLQINLHSPADTIGKTNVIEEFKWLKQNFEDDAEINRWLLRGQLAVQPDQGLIRTYALNKPSAEDAVVLIRALSKIGQQSTAEQIAKKFADDANVIFEIAFQEKTSQPEDALVIANKIIELKSTNPVALALRCYLLESADKRDQAVVDIESALIFWPEEIEWHKKAGELWNSLGNETKAIVHYEFIKERNQGDVDSGLILAKTYLSAKNIPAAVELLGELAKVDPNKYEIWENLSDAQFESGLVNEALDSAEMAIKVNPFSVKPYLLKAQVDLDNGLVDKAYDQVKQADERIKDDGMIKVFLAKVLNAKGDKSGALAALEEATHCSNLNPKTILEEIGLIKDINGTGSARNLIEYFAKQMPENTELLSLLAESQLENGDSHGAEVTARRVLKLKPDSKNMLMFIGKQQLKKGQLDQAIHTFSQVVTLDPENLEAHYKLHEAYSDQRQMGMAVDILNRIMEIDPNQTDAFLKMATIYKDSKNYKMAEEMLKKAVELEPRNVAIKRQLGALLALNLVHQSQEVSSQL